MINHEVSRVNTLLDSVTGTTVTKKKTDQDNDKTTEEAMKIRKQLQAEIAPPIRPLILKWQLYGIREMIYFILNFIAWYGYGMCIVVYYFPVVLQQPDYVRILLFYFHNDDADWYGNFAGDVMWTIEPIIILLSPYLIQRCTTTTTTTTSSSSNRQPTPPPASSIPPVPAVDDKAKTE